jgi:TRAP-type C4-dicarboxylate transport system substrate-binding protein
MIRTFVLAALAALAPQLAAAEKIAVSFGYPGPLTSQVHVKGVEPWFHKVEQDSAGEVEWKIFGGGSVGTFKNIYDRLLNGVVDTCYGLFGELAGQFPKSDVVTLPFETRSSYDAGLALYRLYSTGVTADEFAKVKVVGFGRYPYAVMHARKPINGLTDLKGLKMSAFSRISSQVIENLGGVPVTMPVSDVYQSLQRGLIDVTITAWVAVETYKYHEITKFNMEAPISSNHAFMFMNRDSYAKLSGKAKDAFDRDMGEVFTKGLGHAMDEVEDAARSKFTSQPDQTTKQVPGSELAQWKARVQPTIDEWAKNTPDGARVLAAYRSEIAKIQAEPRAPK